MSLGESVKKPDKLKTHSACRSTGFNEIFINKREKKAVFFCPIKGVGVGGGGGGGGAQSLGDMYPKK